MANGVQPAPKTSWAPTAKVSVGVLAAAVTTLALLFMKKAGFDMTGETGAAMTSIVTFVIQYLVPERT